METLQSLYQKAVDKQYRNPYFSNIMIAVNTAIIQGLYHAQILRLIQGPAEIADITNNMQALNPSQGRLFKGDVAASPFILLSL